MVSSVFNARFNTVQYLIFCTVRNKRILCIHAIRRYIWKPAYFIINQNLKCSSPLIRLPGLEINSNLRSLYCFTNHNLIKLTINSWISTHLLLINIKLLFLNIVLKLYFTLPIILTTSCKYINQASRLLCMIYISLKFLENHEISIG